MNQPDATYRPPVTEDQLIELLRARDKRGAGLLYDMYSAAMFGAVHRIVKDAELTEDIVHDAFVKIWNTFSNYDSSKGRLFTWLLAVARNLALDVVRSSSYKTSQQNRDGDEIVDMIDAQGGAELHHDHIGLQEFVEKLKPEQKKIVDLIYFEGYTQSEVAEDLNIPIGTVKTRLRAAVNILRESLGVESGES